MAGTDTPFDFHGTLIFIKHIIIQGVPKQCWVLGQDEIHYLNPTRPSRYSFSIQMIIDFRNLLKNSHVERKTFGKLFVQTTFLKLIGISRQIQTQ